MRNRIIVPIDRTPLSSVPQTERNIQNMHSNATVVFELVGSLPSSNRERCLVHYLAKDDAHHASLARIGKTGEDGVRDGFRQLFHGVVVA